MKCRFCEIIAQDSGPIVCHTKHTITVLSDPRLMKGHLLVIPKRHVERLSELTKEERDDLLESTMMMQEKILTKIAPGCDISQHYRPFIPDNRFKLSHLHIHIRPRTLNDELFEKVQIREKEVFADIEDGECEKYKKLLN